MREVVLYYAPENAAYVGLIKGVLVQMGIKIKNLTPGRCEKKIGHLAGLDGFEDEAAEGCAPKDNVLEGDTMERGVVTKIGQQASPRAINEELLVLCGFTEERLDQLLEKLKKAGVPRSVMKAIVTRSNAHWTVYELYGHLVEERKQIERR